MTAADTPAPAPPDEFPVDPRVTQALKEYLAAVESGSPPDRPEFLMYRDTPSGKLLMGFMFFTRTLEERGPQPGGSLAPWHFHPWGTRGYDWQGSVSLQHQLANGIGLNVGYFRTWYGNFTVTDNLLVDASSFDT